MSFVPNKQVFSGRILPVTLGVGARAVTIGGSRTLPFYTFDAPCEYAPRIGVEVSDLAAAWTAPALRQWYAGCVTMADYAKRAASIAGVDFLCLRFASADPNGANRSVAACAADAQAAAAVTDLPIVVMGCDHPEKDSALFASLAEVLRGKNALFLSARTENYKSVASDVVQTCGQKVGAESADDINLAKQLNIMLKGLGVPDDSIVMNVGTAAVGYGYEYVASTLDRVRLAALVQGDADLQMPVIAPISPDTWGVKESVTPQEEMPEWGDREERGIRMEIATAAADLTCGADAVILRHPASIAAVKRFLSALV